MKDSKILNALRTADLALSKGDIETAQQATSAARGLLVDLRGHTKTIWTINVEGREEEVARLARRTA